MSDPTPEPDEGPTPGRGPGPDAAPGGPRDGDAPTPEAAPGGPPDGDAPAPPAGAAPRAPAGDPVPGDRVPDDLSSLADAPPAPAGGPPADLSVEALLDDVERLTTERDAHFDRLQRAQAEFENAKKRLQRDAQDRADAAAGRLVEDLLPVLDACDAALAHGESGVEPVFAALLQTLEKNGLERIDPAGDVFDPTRHEAVLHEPAGEGDDPALSVVLDVLRIGYAWKGRVVRAAMVKVRG
ncbi:MAG TPA: nucleotide exchange factor GrpE [Acidimicrobiales bacterium]|nr:nucleotide exchange factor GrpE [Acidimicrobiales bacterium]